MPKIDVTKTELFWPGKYDEDGKLREPARVSLPFQVVESVNESRATREAAVIPKQSGLFDIWKGDEGETFADGWTNKLIWGDNFVVSSALLDRFAGRVKLIYIDPPFATGADFTVTTEVGDAEISVTKEPSLLEEKAYRDTWGGGLPTYLAMIYSRLRLMHELLSGDGAIYVHCDWRVDSAVRLVLDDVFGPSARARGMVCNRRSRGVYAGPRMHHAAGAARSIARDWAPW